MNITKQILEFVQNHWILCGSSVLLVGMLIIEEIKGKVSGLPKLSGKELTIMLNRENAVVLDIRNKSSFETGHILNSINIEQNEIEKQLKKLESNKDKPVVLVDANGNKVVSFGAKLKTHGFTKIYSLTGGIAAWKDAGMPLNKK